jgi:hypothetical protein
LQFLLLHFEDAALAVPFVGEGVDDGATELGFFKELDGIAVALGGEGGFEVDAFEAARDEADECAAATALGVDDADVLPGPAMPRASSSRNGFCRCRFCRTRR